MYEYEYEYERVHSMHNSSSSDFSYTVLVVSPRYSHELWDKSGGSRHKATTAIATAAAAVELVRIYPHRG